MTMQNFPTMILFWTGVFRTPPLGGVKLETNMYNA
jgi:hypothetical protein